jgi:predicted SnoaL-like aldol condensation-catalyzing enzyme
MHALAIAVLIYLAILAPASAADLEANKQLYRNFIEDMWNNRQPSAAECYLAPNFIEHNANLPPGLAGRIQFVTSIQAAFSDYHAEILEIVAEGNMLVTRVQWTGTQDGPFLGRPPTGNKLRFSTADFFRVENGKFAEHWDVVDSLPRAIALGLVPAPTPLAPQSGAIKTP